MDKNLTGLGQLMLAIFYAYFFPINDPSPGATAALRFYDVISGGATVYLVVGLCP